MSVTTVDGPALAWVNGMEVYDSMEPAFRNNFGGDESEVRALLSKYWMRSLWLDPVTTRRIDHVRTEAGYTDLSEAYHDSVEEAYFVAGDVTLSAEGDFVTGDYFWRPPGWVHKAWSIKGFDNILCMEGELASEQSGRVSRVICADHEAGHQFRDGEGGGVGPRGYVRRQEGRFMPWRPHDDEVTGLDTVAGRLLSKELSNNVGTAACSVLVQLPADWSGAVPARSRERFLVNVSGTMLVDGQPLGSCSLVHIPAGEAGPRISAEEDVELFVKVGEAT